MIGVIARKLFGSSNERRIKGYLPRVAEINALEKELEGLSDDALRARTDAFKKQIGASKTFKVKSTVEKSPFKELEVGYSVSGSVTVQNFRHPRAPTLSAASSSAGSILPRASTTLRVIMGKRWRVSTSTTPWIP